MSDPHENPKARRNRRAQADEPDRFPPVNPAPPPARAPRRRRSLLPNLLTVFFLLASVGLAAYFGYVAANPFSPLNPLPPFTPLPTIITATFLPPTRTPTPTPTPEPPTLTPSPEPAATPVGGFPFALDQAAVVYEAAVEGCDVTVIGGRAVGNVGGYLARITGETIDRTVPLGVTERLGPDSFELVLEAAPRIAPYGVQLIAPSGSPASAPATLVTSDRCDQNLVIAAFAPARPNE